MKIAGIDPSLRNTGVVLADLDLDSHKFRVTDMVLIQTEKTKQKQVRVSSDDYSRCRALHESLTETLSDVALVFAELPQGAQSARGMVSNAISTMLLASIDKPLIQLKPEELKLIAGDKNATKRYMIEWAHKRHPYANWFTRSGRLVDKNEHLADAVAAIEAGLASDDFRSLRVMLRHMNKAA